MSGQHRQTPIYLPSSGQDEITYGVASALFGGTAPLVNALLVQRTGNPSFRSLTVGLGNIHPNRVKTPS